METTRFYCFNLRSGRSEVPSKPGKETKLDFLFKDPTNGSWLVASLEMFRFSTRVFFFWVIFLELFENVASSVLHRIAGYSWCNKAVDLVSFYNYIYDYNIIIFLYYKMYCYFHCCSAKPVCYCYNKYCSDERLCDFPTSGNKSQKSNNKWVLWVICNFINIWMKVQSAKPVLRLLALYISMHLG